IVLVYCLMVVLFQSWLDPFIIMAAVPGALVGILWMLALTGTTLNVESLMGSIMAVGIAVSNSILLVSFANDRRVETGGDARAAPLEAGKTRLRPVLMTALARIIGVVPVAAGLGQGGGQNGPPGRAVGGRARAADVAAGPHVRVVRVTAPRGVQTLTLLGEARPYAAVTLYAKVSGYLRRILVDKGDAVGAGQVLALIESPELDQQYEAALADARNKRVNADRFRALAKQNASSAQEAE